MTHKDQEIDRAVRKYTKDLVDSRIGICPNVTTHKDRGIDQVVRKIYKTSDELKYGGMP